MGAGEDGVVDGGGGSVGALGGTVDVLLPLATKDLPEGGAHLLVTVGVDDGVHGRVELGQEQEELLEGEHVALHAEDVQQQQHQARRPADDEGPCGERQKTEAIRGHAEVTVQGSHRCHHAEVTTTSFLVALKLTEFP